MAQRSRLNESSSTVKSTMSLCLFASERACLSHLYMSRVLRYRWPPLAARFGKKLSACCFVQLGRFCDQRGYSSGHRSLDYFLKMSLAQHVGLNQWPETTSPRQDPIQDSGICQRPGVWLLRHLMSRQGGHAHPARFPAHSGS